MFLTQILWAADSNTRCFENVSKLCSHSPFLTVDGHNSVYTVEDGIFYVCKVPPKFKSGYLRFKGISTDSYFPVIKDDYGIIVGPGTGNTVSERDFNIKLGEAMFAKRISLDKVFDTNGNFQQGVFEKEILRLQKSFETLNKSYKISVEAVCSKIESSVEVELKNSLNQKLRTFKSCISEIYEDLNKYSEKVQSKVISCKSTNFFNDVFNSKPANNPKINPQSSVVK